MRGSSAIAALMECFAHPMRYALERHAAGHPVIGLWSHSVPWEIMRAAGLSPVVIRPMRLPAQACDEFLEPGVFSPRIRSLLESVLAGDFGFLTALAFARTSEQDYKAYLYLREIIREERGDAVPRLLFYDLLHSPSPQAYEYGLARTEELIADLESTMGRAVRKADLLEAAEESNAARAAFRKLLALRLLAPRLTGTEAVALLGAFWLVDRATYAALAARAAVEVEQRAPLSLPRLVLAGTWRDDDRLHALLESHGAVVVAEDGGWGARAAGRDVECDTADPVAAIFDKYYGDAPSVRQFAKTGWAWLHDIDPSGIDGVVFYLPPDDSVIGWDVPRERQRLDALGIPSLVIRDDVDDPGMAERWHARIAAFVGGLAGQGGRDGQDGQGQAARNDAIHG